MLKKFKKLKRGSVLVTALIMISLMSIMGWYFIRTTMVLMNHNMKMGMDKKAYYLADAGIQKASEKLWNVFFSIGMVPNKIELFKTYVDDRAAEYTSSGTYYEENLHLGDNGGYKSTVQVKSNDPYSVVVTIISTGQTQVGNKGIYVEKKIEADYKYYLSGTPLADFSYFTNNYGYMMGTTAGGNVATNGFFRFQMKGSKKVTIAGGDRYKNCKNFEPTNKIDDGGLFAVKKIISTDGSKIEGLGDVGPSPPDQKASNETEKFEKIPMPSLAEMNFYETSAVEAEKTAATNLKKHGIYVWVPSGTTILDASDNPDPKYGGGDGILDTGEYIKISDAVYGDNKTTYTGEPSYYCTGANTWKPGEKENLVVTNTDAAHPIEIYGVVAVKGNIVIDGTIKGCGSIYAGKNIYSPDGISYSRPPDEFRGFTDDRDGNNKTDTPAELEAVRQKQITWLKANQPGAADDSTKKDLVGLFAKENIVVGNAVSVPYSSGAIDGYTTSGTIIKGLTLQTGSITVEDPNTHAISTESVNFNETDESKLGMDKVPNTRDTKSSADEEYSTETNGTWDVEFYTDANPPPAGGKNPTTGNEFKKWSGAKPTGLYKDWDQAIKDAVIPGSGEDLDGDGVYDATMDLYDVVCFNKTIAENLRSKYSSYKNIETSPSDWTNAFNFDSTWGGNYNPSSITNLSALSGDSFSNGKWAKKLDGLTYTNHVWGGIVLGDINGGFIARAECIARGGITNHDDRVVGGGESIADAGCQVPQVEHMDIIRWKE